MAEVIIATGTTSVGMGRTLGAYALASVLRAHGYSVQVVDFIECLSPTQLSELVSSLVGPETVAICFSNSTLRIPDRSRDSYPERAHVSQPGFLYPTRELARMVRSLKTRHPACYVMVGGGRAPYCQFLSGVADVIVDGPGEHVIAGLIAAAKDGTLRRGTFLDTNATAAAAGFASSCVNFHASDHIGASEWVPMEVAKGCVFDCKFCTAHLRGKRPGEHERSREVLKAAIELNHASFGTAKYMIVDNAINDSRAKMAMWAQLVGELPFRLQWGCYCRLDAVATQQDLDLLAASRPSYLLFGLETLDSAAGRVVGKGLGKDRIEERLSAVREAVGPDCNIGAYFIVGLPGEDPNAAYSTLDWLVETKLADSWLFYPLFVSARREASGMEQDPAKFGLRHPDPSDQMYWESDVTNFREASRIADEVNLASREHGTMMGYYNSRIANLGYEITDVNRWSRADMERRREELEGAELRMKRAYFDKIRGGR